METTLLIKVTNQKAIGLLRELEELNLIKVMTPKSDPLETKLSDKNKGIITKEQGENLNEHIKLMRNEWNSI